MTAAPAARFDFDDGDFAAREPAPGPDGFDDGARARADRPVRPSWADRLVAARARASPVM